MGRKVRVMFARLFARRIVAFVLALGVFLGGAAPSWAVPTVQGNGAMPSDMAMTMPGMQMQSDCLTNMNKGAPSKGNPCKNMNGSCVACAACALPVVLIQESAIFQLLSRSERAVFTHVVNRNGIDILPALPPPIAIA